MTVSRLIQIVVPALCGLLLMGAAHAATSQCPQQVDVRNGMTVTEFQRAGLNKLDKSQIGALNAWLGRSSRNLCAQVPTAASAEPAPSQCSQPTDVRNVMTVTEFYRAGLNRLDEAQLAGFNAWLSRHDRSLCAQAAAGASGAASTTTIPPPSGPPTPAQGAATGTETAQTGQKTAAPTASSADVANFGAGDLPRPEGSTDRIESRIIGDFYGWTGRTVFKLANGQVWVQAGPGYFRTHLKSPKVTIKKLLIGYVLLVEGYAKEVFVRRIH